MLISAFALSLSRLLPRLRSLAGAALVVLLSSLCAALPAAETAVIPVTSRPLAELRHYPVRSAPATVESLNRSRLSAQLNAAILRIPVRVGEVVRKGALLVELDCRDAQLALEQAQARLKLAQQQLERSRALRKSQNVSEEILNQRQTDFELAQLAVRQQQLQVSRCRVTAPFDGVVVARHAAEGELAAPGTPLLSLLDTVRVEVVAPVLPDQVADARQAGQCWFEAQGRRYDLVLRAVVADINTRTRNRELRFRFKKDKALPGTPGRLKWQAARPVLAAEYLVRRGDSLGVFVLEAGRARFVKLARAREGRAAVIDLPGQTRIIVDGRFSLHDGDAVRDAGRESRRESR